MNTMMIAMSLMLLNHHLIAAINQTHTVFIRVDGGGAFAVDVSPDALWIDVLHQLKGEKAFYGTATIGETTIDASSTLADCGVGAEAVVDIASPTDSKLLFAMLETPETAFRVIGYHSYQEFEDAALRQNPSDATAWRG